ncbi:acylphosphatase [Paludisphaera mucosa]|uniref:acylphosphatase n=1 Tax=Paludisphaera mucosa TaxID=3030827 RepID=A0ABT6FFC7_9BACT|nr:acylphosphatase [Paludisphaera mucosa]MDG3006271.1 acylphosphatase [Paludisphaera mucosa]
MGLERRRILFSGRVQGVGFRATTSWLARGFEVAGYVRNLADGRVEVVAEGDDAELDKFVEAVRGELGGFIRDVDASPLTTDAPPLDGFGVRY